MATHGSKYCYPAEKLAAARRALMSPHPAGEARSYASAFHECMLGLKEVSSEDLDDNARRWRGTIDSCMNDEGIEDPQGRGTWEIKAERLTESQRFAFSGAVDELAHWLEDKCSDWLSTKP